MSDDHCFLSESPLYSTPPFPLRCLVRRPRPKAAARRYVTWKATSVRSEASAPSSLDSESSHLHYAVTTPIEFQLLHKLMYSDEENKRNNWSIQAANYARNQWNWLTSADSSPNCMDYSNAKYTQSLPVSMIVNANRQAAHHVQISSQSKIPSLLAASQVF